MFIKRIITVPEYKNRNKKKVHRSKKDIEVILEMNSDIIINRLLNNEGDIELFILKEYDIIHSKDQNNKKKNKLKK